MQAVYVTAVIIGAYLIGSLSGSLIIGPLMGRADPRKSGSHNAGATNALRTGGKLYGGFVLFFDAVKGIIAVTLVPATIGAGAAVTMACGAGAVIGHLYPIFFGFRGGKGFATVIGILIVTLPLTLLVGALTFVIVLVASGYVGLATVLSMWVLTLFCVLLPFYTIAGKLFVVAMSCVITYTHRANLERVFRGTENRFERIMWRPGK